MSTSEGLSTGRSGDSRSHQWCLLVDGNVAYHLTHNAGKSWHLLIYSEKWISRAETQKQKKQKNTELGYIWSATQEPPKPNEIIPAKRKCLVPHRSGSKALPSWNGRRNAWPACPMKAHLEHDDDVAPGGIYGVRSAHPSISKFGYWNTICQCHQALAPGAWHVRWAILFSFFVLYYKSD
jgi:hypothetical protein